METYSIEIVGLITVNADSKEDAIQQVKDMFEDELLTYNDLSFSCDED